MNKVCIIGLGYIGLPTAAVAAKHGCDVLGVDVNQHAVDVINQGSIHIVENGLEAVVRDAVEAKRLRASTVPAEADVFILAVPTPMTDDKKPQLSYVEAASRSIAPFVQAGNLIILESTSPVGTTEKVASWIKEERGQVDDLHFVHCPERVLPGKILEELENNDRIIGGLTPEATKKAIAFYRQFVRGECLATTARLAEMSKLTENAFRDVNIAFANELSLICDEKDIDVWELIRLANHHPRVNILNPGPGVGGHCIAVDPWFIVDSAPKTAKLIKAAREVNCCKPGWVVDQVEKMAAQIKSPKIACLGLAFKPNIDDLRESPAIEIVEKLADHQIGELLVVEPHIESLPDSLKSNKFIRLLDINEAIKAADVILVLVAHECFKRLNKVNVSDKCILDTCGLFLKK